jgi:hypothetical protein
MENPTHAPTIGMAPKAIMKDHDPNDDPFADLVDDSSNQLISPLEYGSGAIAFQTATTTPTGGTATTSTSSPDETLDDTTPATSVIGNDDADQRNETLE